MYDPHAEPVKSEMVPLGAPSAPTNTNPIVSAQAIPQQPIAVVGTVAARPHHGGMLSQPINGQPPADQQVENQRPRPPPGRWADSICDWPNNMYPSCYCVCCCWFGMWLNAQMAQKTGCASFTAVMWCFAGIWVFAFIIGLLFGSAFIVVIPLVCAFLFALGLRLHVVRQQGITECGEGCINYCGEFCCAFWCWYCSVTQMARHLYGYKQVLDGDGDPYRPDGYAPVGQDNQV